ncbi:uncharacterized protein LOC141703007 [Apium graveolens]|uniref:uncharacterized protein LOC141703007 n=1 Tax=Apium graveolens TaxID=4045 RepID=UPI003D79131F
MSTVNVNKLRGGSFGLSYPMLDRGNYTSWSIKIKVFIQAQGVWGAVEPNDPKAAVEDKIDKIALAMVYQGIPEDVLLSIAEKKTAKATCEAIKTLCQGAERVKKARVQTLKTEFETLSMKESDLLDDFYIKIIGLVTNIRALGEEFGNINTMSVENAVGSLKAYDKRIKKKCEINDVKLMLTEEEWRKRENNEGKLLLTREEWLKHNNRSSEGQPSVGRSRDKSRVRCFNCSAYEHFAFECKKPKRNREQKQESNLTQIEDDEPALLLAKFE